MAALDATVMGTAANSYLTVAEAGNLLDTERLYAPEWDAAASDTVRGIALIWAATIMDRCFESQGSVRDLNQSMAWPRQGAIDQEGRFVDFDTIPRAVKQAQAELALFLLRRDRSKEPKIIGLGLSSANIGPLSVNIDASQLLSLIPRTVAMLMYPLAWVRSDVAGAGGGIRSVRLERA